MSYVTKVRLLWTVLNKTTLISGNFPRTHRNFGCFVSTWFISIVNTPYALLTSAAKVWSIESKDRRIVSRISHEQFRTFSRWIRSFQKLFFRIVYTVYLSGLIRMFHECLEKIILTFTCACSVVWLLFTILTISFSEIRLDCNEIVQVYPI